MVDKAFTSTTPANTYQFAKQQTALQEEEEECCNFTTPNILEATPNHKMRLKSPPPDRTSSSSLDPTQPFDPLDKGNYDSDQKSNSRATYTFHIMSFFLIGTSSWLLVTGIFTECNVLVNEKISPEGRRIFRSQRLSHRAG